MKFLLITNPNSGTASKGEIVRKVTQTLSGPDACIHTAYTSCKGDGFRIAQKAVNEGVDALIALGGDGTVNEIASALIGSEIPLGIIPCGSGNGLARHLGIPQNPVEAAEIIRKKSILKCDYGTVNSHPFFCTSGIGFDAKVSEAFSRHQKRGPATYIQSILSELTSYKSTEYLIECEKKAFRLKAFILTVCNASQYGNNAYISPQASLTDGLLDMTLIAEKNPLKTVALGIEVMTGRIDRDPDVKTYKSASFKIIRKGCTLIHIDGDPLLLEGDLHFKCHKAGLNVFSSGERTVKPLLAPWED